MGVTETLAERHDGQHGPDQSPSKRMGSAAAGSDGGPVSSGRGPSVDSRGSRPGFLRTTPSSLTHREVTLLCSVTVLTAQVKSILQARGKQASK